MSDIAKWLNHRSKFERNTKYNLNNSTSYLLSEKLYELNGKLKQNPPTKKVSENALEKSAKTGCFIFLLRKEKLQELI